MPYTHACVPETLALLIVLALPVFTPGESLSLSQQRSADTCLTFGHKLDTP